MNKSVAYLIATWFGVGYCPFASGTAGSFAALPFVFLAAYFGGAFAVTLVALLVYIVGTFATMEVLKYTDPDPSLVVIDEVLGQFITLIPSANALVGNGRDWWLYVVAFFLFRLFDIVKPWPANYFDSKVINAHGVMLDDVFAGIYAAAVIEVIKCIL
ncbi:MAG: phosphatidylglycerophosphatase A [Rickettsiales bacterium]|jgi:phosphatidylglycerophosphatase A|nr:phosphatidylglycerophosphatase A [Rickettsiales bacterium]